MGARTPNCQTFSLIWRVCNPMIDSEGFPCSSVSSPSCIGRRWLLDLRVRSASPAALKDQRPGANNWRAYRRWKVFLKRLMCHCLIFITLLGVKRGFKMIPSHRALSSFNMSSYQVIWTHSRPNSIFLDQTNLRFWSKNLIFSKCKSHHLAILINMWHTWEDGSRKVSMEEINLGFFHGNFWLVISQAVQKPCPEGWLWVLPFP